MKILILTVTAGEGHNAVCRAVSTYLKEQYGKSVELKQIDIFCDGAPTRAKKHAAWLCNVGYFILAKRFLKIANNRYNSIRFRDNRKDAPIVRKLFIQPAKELVHNTLISYKPDAVMCSHIFGAIIMSDLRKQGLPEAVNARSVFVQTDYVIAPYTELVTNLDYVVTPSDDFDSVLLAKGFDLSQRRSLGIPVQCKFAQYIDKQQARNQLGLPNKHTVLVMSGGEGFGNVKQVVLSLNKCRTDIQIICICGHNKKLKEQLEQLKADKRIPKDIIILGFVDNVDVIMSASDVLISKLGALTTTEALNKQLPIIATSKLPFQEQCNMQFLSQRNLCQYMNDDNMAYKYVDNFFANQQSRQEMVQLISNFRKPNSARDIGDLLYKGN